MQFACPPPAPAVCHHLHIPKSGISQRLASYLLAFAMAVLFSLLFNERGLNRKPQA
jgi:hypothetical protein